MSHTTLEKRLIVDRTPLQSSALVRAAGDLDNLVLHIGKLKRIHVGFDDPPRLAANARTEEEAMSHYRRVRDEIRKFIETFTP